MHARNEIYTQTSDILKELNLFEWIDLYKGQMDGKAAYPTGFTCAFVSIRNIQYVPMPNGLREGRTVVEIRLFFNQGGDTFYTAQDKEESLKILNTVSSVTNKIEFLEGECFTQLELIGEEDMSEQYQRPAYKLSFSTLIYNLNTTVGYVPN